MKKGKIVTLGITAFLSGFMLLQVPTVTFAAVTASTTTEQSEDDYTFYLMENDPNLRTKITISSTEVKAVFADGTETSVPVNRQEIGGLNADSAISTFAAAKTTSWKLVSSYTGQTDTGPMAWANTIAKVLVFLATAPLSNIVVSGIATLITDQLTKGAPAKYYKVEIYRGGKNNAQTKVVTKYYEDKQRKNLVSTKTQIRTD